MISSESPRRRLPFLRVRNALAVALAVAAFVGPRPFAWAVCADGSTFPAGGYVAGQSPVVDWAPNVFTGTLGSIFVPDDSVFEHNDPGQPLTGGGHNWVFDLGSTLCKVSDVGPAGGAPTSWSFPSVSSSDCLLLEVVNNNLLTNIGDIPLFGDVLTPTCNPALLSQPGAPNPANTYFNQLGCSISHGVATTPQTATSYLFTAGQVSGLWSFPLVNVANPVVGGGAGKVVGLGGIFYSAIPPNQKLTAASVSKDGRLAIATSRFNLNSVFACLNPLGDPGDPSQPINPSFSVPNAGPTYTTPAPVVAPCMQIGNNNLHVDQSDAFGPDNQPYFAGQLGANTFGQDPGGTANAAWPQCIWKNNGSLSLADAFAHKRQGGCGNAQANLGFMAASIAQPGAILAHGQYIYAGTTNGTVVQIKVTADPATGLSRYTSRTYLRNIATTTSGIGVADDLESLVVYDDPSGIGAAGQELVWKAPLCEDM